MPSYPISTTTNLGPLTTAFVPPSDCSTPYVTMPSWPECFPRDYAAYRSRNEVDRSIAVYSPGLVCPAGWSAACSLSRRSGEPPPSKGGAVTPADWYIWNMIREGETAIGCCPSRYTCDDLDNWDCEWVATPGDVLSGMTYESGGCTPTPTSSAINVGTTETVAYAGRIILVRAAGDAAPAETTGSSGGTGADGSQAGGASGPAEEEGGLSTGAKITIGVVVPVAVILLGLALFFLFRKMRQRKRQTPPQGTGEGGYDAGLKPELEGSRGPAAAIPDAHAVAYDKPELDDFPGGRNHRPPAPPLAFEMAAERREYATPELQGSSNHIPSELGVAQTLPPELDHTSPAGSALAPAELPSWQLAAASSDHRPSYY